MAAPTARSAEQEVLDAYAKYWTTYSDALFALDDRLLPDVMVGARLDRAREEIRTLRAQQQAVRIVVKNAPVVTSVQTDTAVVMDVYENSSYLIDAVTKQPVSGTGTPNTLRDAITLERVGGVWKVRDAIRQADGR